MKFGEYVTITDRHDGQIYENNKPELYVASYYVLGMICQPDRAVNQIWSESKISEDHVIIL